MAEGLGEYFEKASGEQIADQQKKSSSASHVSRNQKVNCPGKYLMKAKTTIFRTKEAELVCMPRSEMSNKGSLSLVVNLEVVEGTPNTDVGSYISSYIVLLPSPDSTPEKIENTYKYSKPVLCALLGTKEITISQDWLREHFLFDYTEDSPGKFTITRDHKMTQVVMVTVEYQVYNGKESLKVTQIAAARHGDHSVEFKIDEATNAAASKPVQSASASPVSMATPAAGRNVSLDKSDAAFDPSAAANSAVDEY